MTTTEMRTELEERPERPVVKGCAHASTLQYIWALVFAVTLCVGILALRHLALPTPLRYVIPFVPLLTGAQYILVMVRDNRRQQDELQLRIYLEAAMAVVCGLF